MNVCSTPPHILAEQLRGTYDSTAELSEVRASVGLSDCERGSENIFPNVAPNGKLHKVKFLARAAAGSASVVRGAGRNAILDSERSSSRID